MPLRRALSGGSNSESDQTQRYYGVVIGVVSNIDDPENTGRVKVRFPWLSSDEESHWARVCQFMTGNDRGSWFIPEVNDEVLVAFEHGDVNHPYVVGSLYNGQDQPPSENSHSSENNIRMIKSRSGHIIKIDDTSGSEQVEIKTSSGKSVLTMKSDGSITIKSENITIEGTMKIDLKSQNINIEASQQLKLKGTSGFAVESTGTGKVEASGPLTVKGAVVNIN
jgi:uncharacterized protein involved in type VI secretion and phage assembly